MAAREPITAVVQTALDGVIPADETQPLKGRTFHEWEGHRGRRSEKNGTGPNAMNLRRNSR